MKFNLNDFMELDTKELLGVNGGGSCGGTSRLSGGKAGRNSDSSSTEGSSGGGSSSVITGGGACSGTSGRESPQDDGEISGRGNCSSVSAGKAKEPDGKGSLPAAEKGSGTFGQITDDSYADKLTMQYYKNNPKYMFIPGANDNAMNGGYLFSRVGCLMTAAAKVAAEKTGEDISLIEINKRFDKNSDGLLSFYEIQDGFNDLLGDEYNIKADFWENKLSKDKFIAAANEEDTYVLARAYDDYDGDGTKEHHWIVLEGFSTDDKGKMIFTYDGTSDNDVGRTYIYGGEPSSKKEFVIDKIETFRITRK